MSKDLTNSQVGRQNILNNELAISEIQKTSKIDCMFFEQNCIIQKKWQLIFFKVNTRTIERYISSFSDELKENGYTVLKGNGLKDFLKAFSEHFGADINVGTKIIVLGVFNLRVF